MADPAVRTLDVAPLRFPAELPLRARSCLIRVQIQIASTPVPSDAERLAFWAAMLEWSSTSVAALEGKATMAHGDDGTSG